MDLVTRTRRPEWLRDLDEFPHQPQDRHLWSENYLSMHYSVESGVGVWLHLRHEPGEQGADGVWEEMLVVCLPDGDYLTAKNFGRGQVRRSLDGGEISGGALTFRCEEPFRRWRYQFHGAARHLSREQMWAGPLVEGLHVPVSIDLQSDVMSPPFDYGETLDQSWASAHYDQHIQTRGRIRFEGRTLDLVGAGLRDHSWGPRDWSKLTRHAWILGQFPESGRGFMIADIEATPAQPDFGMLLAIVTDGESARPVKASGWKLAGTPRELAEDFEFSIRDEDQESTVRVQIGTPIPMHLLPGPEMGMGVPDPLGNATHDYVCSFVRAEWDGEPGSGYSERTRQVPWASTAAHPR